MSQLVENHFGTGGFDLVFTLPAMTSGKYVKIQFDSVIKDEVNKQYLAYLTLERSSTTEYYFAIIGSNGREIERFTFAYPSGSSKVRVCVWGKGVSLMMDDQWIVTLWLRYVDHPDRSVVKLTGNVTITDVRKTELCDCHEQIAIDVESAVSNALSSILQRRPIQSWSVWTGDLCFAYTPPIQVVDLLAASHVETREQLTEHTSSDALIYSRATSVSVDPKALQLWGFITKVSRFPEEIHGGLIAGKKTQEIGRQEVRQTTISTNLLPQLEVNDHVHYYVMIGNGAAAREGELIATDLQITVAGPSGTSTIAGREAL